MLPSIEKVVITKVSPSKPYIPKVIVFKTNKFLIDNYTLEYLENNQILALCFDDTPLDKLDEMDNYGELLEYYNNSHRLLVNKIYIGSAFDKVGTINDYMNNWFRDGFELVDIEFVVGGDSNDSI